MTRPHLYFDHNADSQVTEAGWAITLRPLLTTVTLHQAIKRVDGQARLEQARADIALYHVQPEGVLLTSGGTESDAMAPGALSRGRPSGQYHPGTSSYHREY